MGENTTQAKKKKKKSVSLKHTAALYYYFSLILELSFKQLTIGIWSGKGDGPLSVVTAMGVILLKFCQLLVRNYNRNNEFHLCLPLPLSQHLSHSSQSVTFSLDATRFLLATGAHVVQHNPKSCL